MAPDTTSSSMSSSSPLKLKYQPRMVWDGILLALSIASIVLTQLVAAIKPPSYVNAGYIVGTIDGFLNLGFAVYCLAIDAFKASRPTLYHPKVEFWCALPLVVISFGAVILNEISLKHRLSIAGHAIDLLCLLSDFMFFFLSKLPAARITLGDEELGSLPPQSAKSPSAPPPQRPSSSQPPSPSLLPSPPPLPIPSSPPPPPSSVSDAVLSLVN